MELIKQQEVLGQTLRVYGTWDEPLFLAKDVATWIDYGKNTGEMLATVDEDEKLTTKVSYSGQNRKMWFLTEYGVYEVLMQSRKPIAKAFKKEVKAMLKEIRTTGSYQPKQAIPKKTKEELRAEAKSIMDFVNNPPKPRAKPTPSQPRTKEEHLAEVKSIFDFFNDPRKF